MNKYAASHILCFCLVTVILAAGCAPPQKQVSSYPVNEPPAAASGQVQADTSKAPPQVVQNIPQQDIRQEKSNQADVGDAVTPDMILPALTLVDDRIIAYEGKLKTWTEMFQQAGAMNLGEEQQQKIGACRQQIEAILSGYNELHELLLEASSFGGGAMTSTGRLAAVEREDMAFLESDCQQIVQPDEQSGGWIGGTRGRMLLEREKEIAEAVEQGDYGRAVSIYEQFTEADTAEVSIETAYHYALAVLRTGNAQQAGMLLQELLTRIRRESSLQKEFEIMKLVADISFGQEDYSRAFERYVDVINRYAGLGDNVEWARLQQSVIASRGERGTEVKSFADLLLSYLSYNPLNDGYTPVLLARNFSENYPESPLNPTAVRIYMESRDKADAWFAGILEQIERFQAEKRYDEGLVFIEQLPRINLLPEKQEQVKMLADEMVTAQFEEAETQRLELELELEETWNTGQAHLREKEYDKAIAVFATLLDTAYADRARMQVDEAAQLAAQENRRKAAELFVRANRSTELDAKLDLLFESRQLLREILEKYPQSDLVDKVKRNMERIEEEITAIDPTLLDSAANGELPGGSEPGQTGNSVEHPASSLENTPVAAPVPAGKE